MSFNFFLKVTIYIFRYCVSIKVLIWFKSGLATQANPIGFGGHKCHKPHLWHPGNKKHQRWVSAARATAVRAARGKLLCHPMALKKWEGGTRWEKIGLGLKRGAEKRAASADVSCAPYVPRKPNMSIFRACRVHCNSQEFLEALKAFISCSCHLTGFWLRLWHWVFLY